MIFVDGRLDRRSPFWSISPLEKFLQAHVGRPWDAVYSELRRLYDYRSPSGRWLLHYLTGRVETDYRHLLVKEMARWYYVSGERFYVDACGILQKSRRTYMKWRGDQYKGQIRLDDADVAYRDNKCLDLLYRNGCWFRAVIVTRTVAYDEVDYSSYMQDADGNWHYTRMHRFFREERDVTPGKQLNTKELRKAGLQNNDPQFADH
jgi:hypothetical protein